MSGYNRAIICGNVGNDPEIRATQSGSRNATFSIATSKKWTAKNGEQKEATQWHKIVVWNEHIIKILEQYVRKGSTVLVEGEIETRKWQDKSGKDCYTTEIVIASFGGQLTLLGSAKQAGSYDDGYTAGDGGYGSGSQNRKSHVAAAPRTTSAYKAAPAKQLPLAAEDDPYADLNDSIPW